MKYCEKVRVCDLVCFVCTCLREVSLLICKGKSVVLKLIAAKAGMCCIYSSFRKPNITLHSLWKNHNFDIFAKHPPLPCRYMNAKWHTLVLHTHPRFSIWVRFSISVLQRSQVVQFPATECIATEANQCTCSLCSALKMITGKSSSTHAHARKYTNTYHKHRCVNTYAVTVELYFAFEMFQNSNI